MATGILLLLTTMLDREEVEGGTVKGEEEMALSREGEPKEEEEAPEAIGGWAGGTGTGRGAVGATGSLF